MARDWYRAKLAGRRVPLFYVAPSEGEARYEFSHPEGTGHESSPFKSIWIVSLGAHTENVLSAWNKSPTPGVSVLRDLKALERAGVVSFKKRKSGS